MSSGAAGEKSKKSIDLEEFNKRLFDDQQTVRALNIAAQSLWFDVIDMNHDGLIQWKEFELYFNIWGIKNSAIAKASFEMIDTNKDGVLSKEEFVAAAVEFYTSRDDTPSKFFYGPLVY